MFSGATAYRQRGITALGALVLAFLIGFWVLLGIKLMPHYKDYVSMKDVFSQFESGAYADVGIDKKKIISKLQKLIRFNDINTIDVQKALKDKTLIIEKNKTHTVIDLTYEIREPIVQNEKFGNYYVLIQFNLNAQIPNNIKPASGASQ